MERMTYTHFTGIDIAKAHSGAALNGAAEIKHLIAQSKALTAKAAVMTSLTGIGRQTAAVLAGFMPGLGTLTRRKAASLAGWAPHPRDSGVLRGYRATTRRRAVIKRALFMAALSARKSHPALRSFYERRVQNGKKAHGRHHRSHAQTHRHPQRHAPGGTASNNMVDDTGCDGAVKISGRWYDSSSLHEGALNRRLNQPRNFCISANWPRIDARHSGFPHSFTEIVMAMHSIARE
jgi:Transposase IS116/IS110/IS902 family